MSDLLQPIRETALLTVLLILFGAVGVLGTAKLIELWWDRSE